MKFRAKSIFLIQSVFAFHIYNISMQLSLRTYKIEAKSNRIAMKMVTNGSVNTLIPRGDFQTVETKK